MPRAKGPTKPEFHAYAVKLTPQTVDTLRDLAESATAAVGRKISASAVLRALVAFAGRQSGEWVKRELFPHFEEELQAGGAWGKVSGKKAE
jgi:hypothetical protein